MKNLFIFITVIIFLIIIFIIKMENLTGSVFSFEKKIEKESRLIKCWSSSERTSFCLYENACIKNQQILFFLNNKNFLNKKIRQSFFMKDDDGHIRNNFTIQTEILPYNSLIQGGFINSNFGNKKFQIGCHSVLKFEYDNQNIYHWANKLTPFFIFEKLYKNTHCQKIDSTYILGRKSNYLSDWQKNFLKLVTGLKNEQIHFFLKKQKSNLKCFKYLLVPGIAKYFFNDQYEAKEFRKKIKKTLNFEFNRSRIVFVKREKSRIILNQNKVESFLKSKIDPALLDIVYLENMSFLQQVQLMSKARLFISVHGAAQTNMIFMPDESIVFEIAPPHFKNNLYERAALQSSQHYFRLITKVDSNFLYPKFLNNIPLRGCLKIYKCRVFWRNRNLSVNLTEFSFLFEQMLEVF